MKGTKSPRMPDNTPAPVSASDRLPQPGARSTFVTAAIAGMVVVAGCTIVLVGASAAGLALALAGHVAGAALALALMRRGFDHPTLGACNLVTLLRLALTASLLAPLVAAGAAPVAIFAISVTALLLDGADGWLARREGRVSGFGARFDMEVDSALALVLALNIWTADQVAGDAGALVLLIGLPRYVFAAAALLLPWLNGPLPPRFSRKLVCVVQIAALVLLQLDTVAPQLVTAIVAAVATALLWSFARDVLWLWQARR